MNIKQIGGFLKNEETQMSFLCHHVYDSIMSFPCFIPTALSWFLPGLGLGNAPSPGETSRPTELG